MENLDSAAFTAEVGADRAAYVQQVMRAARETLARSRGDQFRERPAEPLGVSEWRSRGSPLAPHDRTSSSSRRPDTQTPTWAEDRAAVFDAICALRELCEALSDQLTKLQKKPWHPVYRAMANEEESKEPLELPSLHSLRQ
jgi:hypothetical protein